MSFYQIGSFCQRHKIYFLCSIIGKNRFFSSKLGKWWKPPTDKVKIGEYMKIAGRNVQLNNLDKEIIQLLVLGEFKKAIKTFEKYSLEKNPNISLRVVHFILEYCKKLNDFKTANIIINLSNRNKLPINYITFSYLISIYSQLRLVDRAFNVLKQMENFHIFPTRSTYNQLIHACSYNKDFNKAIHVYQSMKDAGISPDIFSSNAILSVCAECGNIDLLDEYLEKMREQKKSDQPKLPSPNVISYTIAIKAHIDTNDGQGAIELFREMQREQISPDEKLYVCIISGCAKNGLRNTALSLLEYMRSKGLNSKKVSFQHIIAYNNAFLKQTQTLRHFPLKIQQKSLEDLNSKKILFGNYPNQTYIKK